MPELLWYTVPLLFLIYAIILIIPGFLFQKLIIKETSIPLIIGGSIAFGLLIIVPIGIIGYALNLNLLLMLLIQLLFVGVLTYLRRKEFNIKDFDFEWRELVILSLVGIFSSFLSLCSGWYPRGDAAVHIQGIRNILNSSGLVQPHYTLLKQFPIPDHLYDVYYIVLAWVYKFSQIELTVLWHYSAVVFSYYFPFVIYYMGKKMFDNKRFPILLVLSALFMGLFYTDVMYGSIFDTLQYPNRVYLWLIMPVALGTAINMLIDYSRKKMVLTVSLVLLFLFVHQSGFLFFNLMLFGVLILALISGKIKIAKYTFVMLLSVTLSALPILILKLRGNKQFITQASDKIWHSHYKFFKISNEFFAFSYDNYFIQEMWIGFALSIVAFIYVFIKRNSNYYMLSLLAASSFILPAIIIFNPFFVPFLAKIISYVAIVRMFRMPLYFLVLALFLSAVVHKVKRNFFYIIHISLTFIILVSMLYFTIENFNRNGIGHKNQEIVEIIGYISEGSIVLSDKLTSTDISSYRYSRHLVIQFNGAIDLFDISKEKEDVQKVFNGELRGIDLKRLLDSYGVDNVVVNKLAYPITLEENYLNLSFENEIYKVYNYPKN
jgi:hypothetical protein